MAEEAQRRRPWILVMGLMVAPLALAFFVIDQLGFMGGGLSRGQVIGRDFINYWSGSRLLLQGRVFEIFDPAAYSRALEGLWGAGLATHSFSYPPSLLPLIAWTGALPYGVALALWSLAGAGALIAVLWPYSRSPAIAIAVLLSPAVLICLDIGQNGLLTAALLVGGLRLADRRPWLAGVLIGLVSFKPQLGLLVPFALIAARRWRVIGGAAASTLALVVASLLMAGPQAWRFYVARTLPYQGFLLEHSHGRWQAMTPSPLVGGLVAGLPSGVAHGLQALITVAGIVLVIAYFARLRSEQRAIGGMDILLLVALGFIAAPYSFNYDMASLVLALTLAAMEHPRLDKAPNWRLGVLMLWIAPLVMIHPWIMALLIGAGIALVWRARQPQLL